MKIRHIFLIGVASFVVGSFFVTAQATNAKSGTFFVAVSGSDSWSGRLPAPNPDRTDGPFATVGAACSAARKQGTDQPRKVIIQAGRYFLDKPLELNAGDAGLTIQSAPGADVCLYGGRKVTGWKRDGEKFYSAALPGVKDKKWDFRALVVNGRFCRRARLPEEGFFEHLSRFDVPWMSTTGGGWKRKPTNEELTTLKYRSGDIGPWLDVGNAEVTIYHMWDESMVGLKAMDAENRILTFANPSGHPPGAFGVKNYVIWNVREGMTEPGQWYLDRTAGKLVYWPMPGEDMTKAEVFAPTIESIIRIRGTRENPARDITVRGLTLSVTTTPLEAGGFGAGKFDGAISIASAENCRLIGLQIVNVGGQGIKASGDGLRIERCHVYNAGACGIRCQGAEAVVADNHIHDVGLTYPSAIALQGGGRDCLISHNEIHDCPYTAINCGGERNRIEHNLIYHAMKELHDGGGIYCFAGKDLVLRGNFIRDIIDTGGYGASAYYLDERSENCLVEGNLSVGILRPSHNHMAKGNTIRNNIFISNADARITFPKSSNYTFEHNVIQAKGQIVLENPDGITTLRNN
ncbi:MAG TPA: right-handed parallel beta-helix repeat-containing protein, partial [Sedimentisphaerales bacterium]|nr:right-handed parallel beta-helix repeat-containing protein [Sedimentisphaerales bacterium]